ncbi:MAG: hypothetical protein ABIQ40_03405 [Bacteroidia bacterium]
MKPESQSMEQPSKLEELIDHVKDCANTKGKILALRATDKASAISGIAVSYMIFAFLIAIIFVLLSIGAAVWISAQMNSSFSGFFIVAGFYLVVLLVLFLGREAMIKRPVANKIISEILND